MVEMRLLTALISSFTLRRTVAHSRRVNLIERSEIPSGSAAVTTARQLRG
jgi:hypothetical protein